VNGQGPGRSIVQNEPNLGADALHVASIVQNGANSRRGQVSGVSELITDTRPWGFVRNKANSRERGIGAKSFTGKELYISYTLHRLGETKPIFCRGRRDFAVADGRAGPTMLLGAAQNGVRPDEPRKEGAIEWVTQR
jgi:hypothetical protein